VKLGAEAQEEEWREDMEVQREWEDEGKKVEIQLAQDQDRDRAADALHAFTRRQTQIAGRIVVIRNEKPVEMDLSLLKT
jgi:DNA gyrase/topoisomerase IV subunit A